MNRASENCGAIIKDWTVVSSEHWKERRDRVGLKKHSKKIQLKIL